MLDVILAYRAPAPRALSGGRRGDSEFDSMHAHDRALYSRASNEDVRREGNFIHDMHAQLHMTCLFYKPLIMVIVMKMKF